MSKTKTQSGRFQQNVNKVIGQMPDGDFVALQYVFKHEDGFQGAVGSSFNVVTLAQYNDAMDPENLAEHLEDLYNNQHRDNMNRGQTLDEWVKDYVDSEGDAARFDLSYSNFHEAIIELHDAAVRKAAKSKGLEVDPDNLGKVVECTGGGRMFCKDGTRGNLFKAFTIKAPGFAEMVKLIGEFETETVAEESARRKAEAAKYKRA